MPTCFPNPTRLSLITFFFLTRICTKYFIYLLRFELENIQTCHSFCISYDRTKITVYARANVNNSFLEFSSIHIFKGQPNHTESCKNIIQTLIKVLAFCHAPRNKWLASVENQKL